MVLRKTNNQVDYCHSDHAPCIVEVPCDSVALQSILLRHKVFCLTQPATASDFVTSEGPDSHTTDIYWLAHIERQVVGCISFRSLTAALGEVKSLHVLEASRRHGIADALLRQVIYYARSGTFREVCLETGATDGFAPARRLYRRAGFIERDAFPPYLEHPSSCFMTLKL